jgi:hypothetical protein
MEIFSQTKHNLNTIYIVIFVTIVNCFLRTEKVFSKKENVIDIHIGELNI